MSPTHEIKYMNYGFLHQGTLTDEQEAALAWLESTTHRVWTVELSSLGSPGRDQPDRRGKDDGDNRTDEDDGGRQTETVGGRATRTCVHSTHSGVTATTRSTSSPRSMRRESESDSGRTSTMAEGSY